MICVGIDTGVNTGFAVWSTESRQLTIVTTLPIHQALIWVKGFAERCAKEHEEIKVYFEDARLRKWYGTHTAKQDRDKLQGAGSVKRDSKIWEDALTEWGIPFETIAPKNNWTKMTANMFAALTGWKGRTNEHSRDAAMLVFGR